MADLNPSIGAAVGLAALLMAWWPMRQAHARAAERAFDARYPRNADGFIVGAEPRLLPGHRRGAVLVLHGFNDSPQAMRSTADALHAAGWTVRVPALPGHARSLADFARSGSRDWEGAARAELSALRASHQEVALCGMSMGGAIALRLAAEDPGVTAVVALAPYLHLPMLRWALPVLAPLAALGPRYLRGGGKRSVRDPVAAAEIIAYRMSTPGLLLELLRVTRRAYATLPQVRQPVLVLQSREDNRIPQASASRAFERIGSTDKTLEWLTGTGHVISVDYGHRDLERRVVSWLNQRLG